MKYTVVWRPTALKRLAELWNAGPDRAEIAAASNAIDQIRALTRGRGADCAIETSGAPTAARLVAQATRRLGRIAVVAWGSEVDFPPLVPLGLEIHGCWHWNHQRYAAGMWNVVRAADSRLDSMITHEFPLERVADAMDLQDSAECGKVFLLPHGETSAG